ncbi:MAG: NAD-dependent epimerase/dehydratase family protein [Phycisphaerales bacterium]|nr:MAG: NAD-dependent epimerase/dehydratase family protein [Phycisphaerales bacterium]
MSEPRTTFMTGATGFLGAFLVRDLLRRGRRLILMLREPVDESMGRLRQSLEALGADLGAAEASGQLRVVSGSLPDRLPQRLDGPVDDLLSNAASLQLFENGNQEPYRTNVEGTRCLIDWCRGHNVRRTHCVSTAYVCGSITQHVDEVFHHPRPQFKTAYEQSKWMAETLLAEWGREPGHVLTVYRPSFLVGDSASGYTCQYGGFYQLARMVSLLKTRYGADDNGHSTHIPLRIPGRPEDPQNFVPVDFAARIITEVMEDESLQGRIYHLTDPNPPTNDQIKRHMEVYFRMHGGWFAPVDEVLNHCTPAESLLWEHYDVLTPRVTHNPRFMQGNTRRVMSLRGIPFPSLDDRLFATLLDFAIAHRWGQRSRGQGGRAGNAQRHASSLSKSGQPSIPAT